MNHGPTHCRRSGAPRPATALAVCWLVCAAAVARGQPPALDTLFPAGAQAGQAVEIKVGGSRLESLQTLHCSVPNLRCELVATGIFRLSIPAQTPPGHYDIWGVGANGVSGPRTFAVGTQTEQIEQEPNDAPASAGKVALNT